MNFGFYTQDENVGVYNKLSIISYAENQAELRSIPNYELHGGIFCFSIKKKRDVIEKKVSECVN